MIFMVPFYDLQVCVETIMDCCKLNKTDDLVVAPVFSREFKISNDATIQTRRSVCLTEAKFQQTFSPLACIMFSMLLRSEVHQVMSQNCVSTQYFKSYRSADTERFI